MAWSSLLATAKASNAHTLWAFFIEIKRKHIFAHLAFLFCVLFKRETKKTFVQYLTELRMDKAMSLLTGTEMKTVQIAQEVGIPDPSYFSYSFKKSFGISPSQARKREGATL